MLTGTEVVAVEHLIERAVCRHDSNGEQAVLESALYKLKAAAQ